MAINWTVAEATKDIITNNGSGVQDYGKRFPDATVAIATLIAKAEKEAGRVLKALPENYTMNKLNAALKGSTPAADTDDAVEEIEETVKEEKVVGKAKGQKPGKSGKFTREELEAKGIRELREMAGAAGIVKGKSKDDVINNLLSGKKAAADAPATGAKKETKAGAKTGAKSYDKMTAKQAYDELVARGIPAKLQRPAETYISQLRVYDKMVADEDYEKFTPRMMYVLCTNKGIEVETGLSKDDYLAALEPEEEATDAWEDEAAEDDDDEAWEL